MNEYDPTIATTFYYVDAGDTTSGHIEGVPGSLVVVKGGPDRALTAALAVSDTHFVCAYSTKEVQGEGSQINGERTIRIVRDVRDAPIARKLYA